MTINNLPSAVQQIVQDGWLLRFFDNALYPNLLFRNMYDAMEVPQHLGEQYTFTKKGLLPVVQTALAPVTNTDLTSGLTPVSVSYEQYSATLSQYAQAVMTNLLSNGISIVDLYKSAMQDLGRNAGQSLDILGRRNMVQAYAGGRTYLTAAATASTTVTVRDTSGFDFVYVNGVRQTTSVSNPHPVSITQSGTAASRNVTGVTPTGSPSDADYAGDLLPGTLTLSAAVTSIIGDSVISTYAAYSLRPNSRTTGFNVTASDVLTLSNLNSISARLRAMGVPTHADGFYHAILDPNQAAQLMNDSAVQKIYETHADAPEFMHGAVGIAGGMKLYQSSQCPRYTNEAGVTVYRGIVTGADTGYEVRSSLIADWLNASQLSANGYVMFSPQHYVAMILRTPIDTLQQVVTNSWSFIGAWLPATDVYSMLGGSSAYYKRCALIESA